MDMEKNSYYYQLLKEFQTAANLSHDELADAVRIDPLILKDQFDTLSKPIMGTFMSTASGLLQIIDSLSGAEDAVPGSGDELRSLYLRLFEEYLHICPDQFDKSFNPYFTKSIANLAEKTGSEDLHRQVRELLGMELQNPPEASPKNENNTPEDSRKASEDPTFERIREAWEALNPSGRHMACRLMQGLLELSEFVRK